jgi:hypothetical protein
VGRRRISLQPGRERERLQFYVDGKPAQFPFEGLNLDGHRVAAFDIAGQTGLRVDYDDQTVVIITPMYWNSYNVWYMDVSVSHARGDEGLMGFVPRDSWLPRLPNGESVGPMPVDLHDRYVTLYQTFADSWRVTDASSLFVYEPGTSTKTFSDPDWPGEKGSCTLKPEFEIPGAPVLEGMPIEKAEEICRTVLMEDLHKNCVFDVATTGDEVFAKSYLLAQELRLYGTTVEVVVDEAPTQFGRVADVGDGERPVRRDESLIATVTVLPLSPERPTPTGSVTVAIDGVPIDRALQLDERGRASVTLAQLDPKSQSLRGKRGRRRNITATYSGGGEYDYRSSSSSPRHYTVAPRTSRKPKRS